MDQQNDPGPSLLAAPDLAGDHYGMAADRELDHQAVALPQILQGLLPDLADLIMDLQAFQASRLFSFILIHHDAQRGIAHGNEDVVHVVPGLYAGCLLQALVVLQFLNKVFQSFPSPSSSR